MHRTALGMLGALLLAVFCTPAHAQGVPDHVVVAATISGDGHLGDSRELANALGEALARAELSTWTPEDARTQFEAAVSAPALELSESDLRRWVESSRSAVRHLARADYDEARAELLEAHQVASRAAAELNREAERARQVLDTCLFMVRALVETRDEAGAMRQARECRQLVPGAEPTPYRHTPEVRDILERVDAQMAAEPPGALLVTSSPAGCHVLLNGISFGVTPFRVDELAAGEFRLQVECNEGRGRIRRVRIARELTEVHVDGEFDLRIRSRPAVGLIYDDADQARASAVEHATRVIEALGSGSAWLAWKLPDGHHRIDLVQRGGVHSVRFGQELDPAQLDAAVEALRASRSVDLDAPDEAFEPPLSIPAAAADAVTLEDAEGRAADGADGESGHGGSRFGARRWAGLALLGAGAVSLGAAVGLHFRRKSLGADFRDEFSLTRQRDWVEARRPLLAVSAVGGAMGVAAMPLLLEERDGVPAAAWVAGGVGVGLVVTGIVMMVVEPSCASFAASQADCIEREQGADRTILLSTIAAPLITAPLVYLLRPSRVTPAVQVDSNGAALSFSGRF